MNCGCWGNVTPTPCGEMLLRRMGADSTPLYGWVFTVLDQSGRSIASAMSSQQGLARFRDLRPGAYRMVETVAPAGHAAVPPMELSIADNGAALIDGQPVHGMHDVRGMMR